MEYKLGFDSEWIDQILELHNKTEMKRSVNLKDKFNKAYSNRYAVATCWDNGKIIGFGTIVSDGEMYSSIYDVVIDPNFQKKGVGRSIVQMLIEQAPNTCIYLSSTFGNEEFYKKLGFKKHKTTFAMYPWESDYLE